LGALAIGGLSACATSPVPQGYTGPIARIQDTTVPRDSTSADIFTLSDVNGKPIKDSIIATRQASAGQGFRIIDIPFGRDVPAQPGTFTLVGETEYGAPILAILNKVYRVSGDIKFTPLEDHVYTVKGVLGPDYSAVWLEDVATHEVIDHKIEVHGSATVGVLEK
jgi:hypothetical protein